MSFSSDLWHDFFPMKKPSLPLLSLLLPLALAACLPTQAQEKPTKSPEPAAESASTNIHLTFEFIEVALADLNDWVVDHPLSSDATELRDTLKRWSKEKRASVIEMVTIHCKSGQRAKAESIAEVIYPTEYDPAQMPATISQVHNLVQSPATPINGTAYEVRNVGVTVEVDPVVSGDRKSVDLNLAPEIVKRLENLAWPNDEVDPDFRAEVPQFYTAKITTQLSVKPGVPSLVGTVRLPEAVKDRREDPVVILFVRADLD